MSPTPQESQQGRTIVTRSLTSLDDNIPTFKIELAVRGAGLLESFQLSHAKILNLPATKKR